MEGNTQALQLAVLTPAPAAVPHLRISEAVQPLTEGTAEDGFLHEQAANQEQQETQLQEEEPCWRRFGMKILCSVGCFLMLTAVLETFAEDQVIQASERLFTHIGLPGLFLAVFLADGLPQPFTYVPLIFMAVKGSVGKPVVFAICGVASYCAGVVGYFVGASIRSHPSGCLDGLLQRVTAPSVLGVMTRKGAFGVAFAALLPIPLAIATWTAGYLGVRFHHFLPAPICRLPKIALFVLLSRAPNAGKAIIEDTILDE